MTIRCWLSPTQVHESNICVMRWKKTGRLSRTAPWTLCFLSTTITHGGECAVTWMYHPSFWIKYFNHLGKPNLDEERGSHLWQFGKLLFLLLNCGGLWQLMVFHICFHHFILPFIQTQKIAAMVRKKHHLYLLYLRITNQFTSFLGECVWVCY